MEWQSLPTILRSKKVDVALENKTELDKLPGIESVYTVHYNFMEKKGGRLNREYVIKAFEAQIETTVRLKVGAQVMLKFNLDVDLGLANGTRGVVTQLEPVGVEVLWASGKKTWIANHVWEYEDDDTLSTASQMPLSLAWSTTIHKSQASTLDSLVVDLGDLFSSGQGYVGLSRVRSAEGLFVSGVTASKKISASKVAMDYINSILVKRTSRNNYRDSGSKVVF